MPTSAGISWTEKIFASKSCFLSWIVYGSQRLCHFFSQQTTPCEDLIVAHLYTSVNAATELVNPWTCLMPRIGRNSAHPKLWIGGLRSSRGRFCKRISDYLPLTLGKSWCLEEIVYILHFRRILKPPLTRSCGIHPLLIGIANIWERASGNLFLERPDVKKRERSEADANLPKGYRWIQQNAKIVLQWLTYCILLLKHT